MEKRDLIKIMKIGKNENVSYIISTLLHILYKYDTIQIEIYNIKPVISSDPMIQSLKNKNPEVLI